MAAENRGLSVARTTILSAILAFASPVRAFTRYIGDPNDGFMQRASRQCGGNNQTNFQAGLCPSLLRCVLDSIPSDISAGLQSGSNIASLVPTIAALIGAPPMDLVQMALIAPHRAAATCCFSIGLPSGLFRQLKPLLPRLGDRIEHEPRVREWVLQLPTASSDRWQYGWRNTLLRVVTDAVILALAAVMLWYTWRITTETMVTWRCEYGVLLFLWPMACIAWLVLAMALLWLIKEKLEIVPINAMSTEPRTLTMWQLMKLPYTLKPITAPDDFRLPRAEEALALNSQNDRTKRDVIQSGTDLDSPNSALRRAQSSPLPRHRFGDRYPTHLSTILPPNALDNKVPTIVIRITMPDDFGLRSWRWYEAILECLAVGIYLYATFVLTSSLFMSGQMGLTYATIITLCLAGLRILGTLF